MIITNNDSAQTFNIIPRSTSVTYTTLGNGTVVASAGSLTISFLEESTNDTFSFTNDESTKYDNYLAFQVSTSNKLRTSFDYFITIFNTSTNKLVYRDKVSVLPDASVPYNNEGIYSISDSDYTEYAEPSNEYVILDD